MESQLVLVMAVVAAGIAVAAVVALRSMKEQHRGGPGKGAAAARVLVATGPQTPAPVGAGRPGPVSDSTAEPAVAIGAAATSSANVAPEVIPAPPQPLSPEDVFAKLYDLALGKTGRGSKRFTGHDHIAAATVAALADGATQQRYAPRRPNMLPKLLSATNDENISRRELASIIARDPSLVGSLLKIANSSYYRITTEPVESVDRAVVLLGTDGIRSLITAALMQPIFRIGAAAFPHFPEVAWEHTFRSANAAVPYNFLVEKSDPFAAELLSLVMGLAGIVVFRVAMDQYGADPRLLPDAGVISGLLDSHSASVARLIGASWELSEQTLSGLDGQTVATTSYPTALGRSLYFGRLVGALAVLRINHVIDDEIAKASIPPTKMAEGQLDRMWARLMPKPGKE